MESVSQNPNQHLPATLAVLESSSHAFVKPAKRIQEGHDVPLFLSSKAYSDIGSFIMMLNISMCPRKSPDSNAVQKWQLDTELVLSEPVTKLQELLGKIDSMIDEAPPDMGPRRFGNVSFRKWYRLLEDRVHDLLKNHLPSSVLRLTTSSPEGTSVLDELTPYILGGFGSAQRLDYGTGHELSFIAFLGCIWKLGGFGETKSSDGALERSIVIGIVEPYLRVVRRLILTYTLEPAGSHGVWGLDDHSFVSYIFGSSQYCPPISGDAKMPVEGALVGSPDPGDVAKKTVVDRERRHNMYFSAVGFINDVKSGPFWEHSPLLFDISGVRSGWGKINKGMIKMYNAEVLSKFPVVQHFPFGSLFSWDQDPNAATVAATVNAREPGHSTSSAVPTGTQPATQQSTQAPWAKPAAAANIGSTQAPWAQVSASTHSRGPPPTRMPPAGSVATREPPVRTPGLGTSEVPTRAPWAKNNAGGT